MSLGSSYADDKGGSGSKSLKWSALGLIGKQGVVLAFSVLLARLLGPQAYGLVAQATVYIALTTLLLDQGVSAALTNVGVLSRRTAGAAVTLNLLLAVVLSGLTFAAAPFVSAFFREPDLTPILDVLGVALLFKAGQIVPRLLLSRHLDFRSIALSDFAGAALGGLLGLVLALATGSYWALVFQSTAMDFVTMVVLIFFARPPLPNRSIRLMLEHIGFSARVFGSNLVGYIASNASNIFIGRFLGSSQVGFYSFAYGFLQLPVSITGQVLNRVLFPVIARKSFRSEPVAELILRALRGISTLTFPLMALLAVAAQDLVLVFLGPDWLPAVPVMMILALSGARQSLTTLNTPILLGLGKASLQLRFSIVAAILQVAAVVVGLLWGIVGVATCFTIAGFLLTPLISLIQKRVANVSYAGQWRAVFPALHASLWLIAAYLGVSVLVPGPPIVQAIMGCAASLLVFFLVIRLIHRAHWEAVWRDIRAGIRRR